MFDFRERKCSTETSTRSLNHLSEHAALISIFNKICSNFVLDMRVSISHGMSMLRKLHFKLKWQIYNLTFMLYRYQKYPKRMISHFALRNYCTIPKILC